MTLEYLMNNTTIQGEIRVSRWAGGDEVEVKEFHYCDDLDYETDINEWRDHRVLFLFTAGDGMLHIELEGDEE